jgi:hypothetical protein
MTDNRLPGSVKPTPHVPGVELHACKRRGRWVGVAETTAVYADAINALWIEGYGVSFVPLDDGGMQIQVREGTSESIRNALEAEA